MTPPPMRTCTFGMTLLAAAAMLTAPRPAVAESWVFKPSYFTHSPATGERVAQYQPLPRVYVQQRVDYVRSAYKHNHISIRGAGGTDNIHVVEEWGRRVRPYGEWLHPYRPYSVPYPAWGPPYGGLGPGFGPDGMFRPGYGAYYGGYGGGVNPYYGRDRPKYGGPPPRPQPYYGDDRHGDGPSHGPAADDHRGGDDRRYGDRPGGDREYGST